MSPRSSFFSETGFVACGKKEMVLRGEGEKRK